MTQLTNLSTHHYNPFVSPDGQQVGYHRCRCLGADSEEFIPVLERHTTLLPGVLHNSQSHSTTLLLMAGHVSTHQPSCKHVPTFRDELSRLSESQLKSNLSIWPDTAGQALLSGLTSLACTS